MYVVEVNAATYYVLVSNEQNTISSNVPEVVVAELPAITPIPALNITLPGDDTDGDGDGYPDGFERFAGSNAKVPDVPPLLSEVFLRKNVAEIIKVGTLTHPVATPSAAKGRVANGGTITIQNPAGSTINMPGALTLGTDHKAMTLQLDPSNPSGPNVRLGAPN